MILVWPVLLIPLNMLIAVEYMSFSALLAALFISVIVVGLMLGCGADYRYRGINPPSRNIINYNDDNYTQAFGIEDLDHPEI